VALDWAHVWRGGMSLWLLGAGMERRDVIFLIGRGCGMVVVLLSLTARELCLVPNKHSSSIFALRLFAREHFNR